MLAARLAGVGRIAPLAARAALHPQALALRQSVPRLGSCRAFGVWDSVQSYTGKLQEEQRQRQFQQQIEGFLKMDRWSLQPMKTMLDDTTTWKTWLMGKAEKEQVKHYKAIFAALTKNEIDNPNLIDREVVERVCAAAKTDAHTVRQFLLMCERLKLLYEYTQLLHRNGEPVPTSEEDFIRMQTMDPRFQRLAVKEMAKAKAKNLQSRAKPVSVRIK